MICNAQKSGVEMVAIGMGLVEVEVV